MEDIYGVEVIIFTYKPVIDLHVAVSAAGRKLVPMHGSHV